MTNEDRTVEIANFNMGGIADSEDMGYPNSMSELVGFDIHSQPGIISPNYKLDKISSTTVNEKIIKQIPSSDGNLYMFSYESGKIWKYNGTTVTLAYTTSATTGESKCLGAYEFRGYIYWTTQNWIHRIAVNKTGDWSANAEANWNRFTKDDVFADIPPFVSFLDGVDDYFKAETAAEMGFANDNEFTFSAWVRLDEGAMEKRNVIWGTKRSANDEFQIEIGRIDGNTKGVVVKKRGTTDTNVAVAGEVKEFQYRTQIQFAGDAVGTASFNISPIPYSKDKFTQGSNTDFSKMFDGEKWVHIVYRRSGTDTDDHSIFVNGVEQVLASSSVSAFTDRATDKYIGACHNNSDFEDSYFSGSIASVLFFDTILTDQEISDLYTYNTYSDSDLLTGYMITNGDTTATNGAFYDYDYNWNRYYLKGATLPDALSEEEGYKKYLYPTQSPVVRIRLNVSTIGTGNWTVTVHDDEDNLIEAETTANGSMTLGYNDFTFDSFTTEQGVRYHIHVHTSTGDGALKTRSPNGVQDADIEIYGEGSSEIHPMIELNRNLYIGDRNMVHQIVSIGGFHGLVLNALDIPQPNKITALGSYETHLLIGTKISDGIGNAKVYRWDTYSVSFNVVDDVDEIGINAFMSADNYTFVQAGTGGSIYAYNGAKLQKMRRIKGGYSPSKRDKIWNDASTMYNSNLHFGLSNIEGNPAPQGVYSYGSVSDAYPRVLNLEYPILDGTSLQTQDMVVTSLCVYNNRLMVAWYDENGGVHGVSEISDTEKISNAYFTTRILSGDRRSLKAYGRLELCYRTLPDTTNTTVKIFADIGDGNGFIELMVTHDSNRRVFCTNQTLDALSLQVKVQVVNTVDQTKLPTIEKLYIRPRGSK